MSCSLFLFPLSLVAFLREIAFASIKEQLFFEKTTDFCGFFGRARYDGMDVGCSKRLKLGVPSLETGCSKAWNWVFQALKLGVSEPEIFGVSAKAFFK